jgi:hypothetical protein
MYSLFATALKMNVSKYVRINVIAAVMEYRDKGSQMCKTIQLTSISMSITFYYFYFNKPLSKLGRK